MSYFPRHSRFIGDAVILVSPFPQINQAAAPAAKWKVRIFVLNLLFAHRAFNLNYS